MSITTGTLLGAYHVQGRVGRGGMGEVYRARDTRLGRDVAIKVLPPCDDASSNPSAGDERAARFSREAQTLASLNHPNIAHIYGLVEDPAGTNGRALVMEFVEGEDLAERIARGPIPVGKTLDIARQIAVALEAAHDQGIVHRDLKPANIKLRADGTVKVLDFGLAKALEACPVGASRTVVAASLPNGASYDFANSATMTSPAMTAMGVILGTAAYMSPEQAKGAAVDRRADIWAFGVVLYEMLTGEQLFGAPTTAEVLAQVLTRTPDFARLPVATPAPIRELLRHCLERDPKRRLRDIADGRLVIEDACANDRVDGRDAAREATAQPVRGRGGLVTWIVVVAVATAAAATVGRLSATRDAAPASPMRLAITLPPNQETNAESNALLTFAPDGQSLVVTANQDGRQGLVRRRLSERTTELIAGTEGGGTPFFSPDGRWLGFIARNRMWKVPVEGGRPFPLAEAEGSGGAEWLADGTIVYVPIYSDGLLRVSADGGTPRRITTPDRKAGELGHWYPNVLPDGRHVIFTAFRTPVDRSRIGVVDLATGAIEWVVDGGFFGRYVASGHLLYAKEQRLYAQPFDAATARTRGPAVPVLDDVYTSQTGGYAKFAVSSQGALAYVTGSLGKPMRELVWIDRTGRAVPATEERRRFLSVSLSPDNQQAALTIEGESQDVWLLSLARGTFRRQTTGDRTEYDPRWSRDGRELFYVVDRPPFELHRMAAGDVDSGRPMWKDSVDSDINGIAVSPDGRNVAYTMGEVGTGANLYWRPIDGSAPARPIRATRADERTASFSPDGRYVVYQSDETGRPEIYAIPFPGPGEPMCVSADGGTEPLWAADGTIFYRRGNELRVVATHRGPPLSFDTPRVLFTFPMSAANADGSRQYDVSSDGSRVLALTVPAEHRPRQVELVTNWLDELRRLVPK